MELFIFWLVASGIVGLIASKRQRSGFLYFLLSMLLSPLLIGVLVLVLGNARPATGVAPEGNSDQSDAQTRCPDCRELVRADARKCKHCGAALVAAAASVVDRTPMPLPRNW